ncbi:MAG TPA: sigma-70 family RNA polymerase sigma factor, partial [Kofleriaceae bacterium]
MAWVRRLARALLRDEAAAEDIAQDTWIVAAEQQPETDRPLRPWLARVVGNLVHTRRRSQARRHAREIAVEDARSVFTPAELVERVELQRAVAEEVLALAEPYRSTVLLHFFEGISSADLAQRLGIPAGTVRRRLKVGLDQLREALRRRADPPERGWLAALAPIAIPSSHASIAVGAIVMKKLFVVVVVLLVALGAGLWWKHRRAADPAIVSGVAARSRTVLARGSASPELPGWLAQDGAPERVVAGHVVAAGSPVAGATVKLALRLGTALEPIAETHSGPDGAFSFGSQPAALVAVSAAAPNFAPVSLAVALADPHVHPDQLVLELPACHARITGTVADAGHGPIAHARVASAGLGGTETDVNGHYEACIAPSDEPGTASAMVHVEADGYGSVEERVIVVAGLHHDFVLAPEAVLVGTVTASGHPVAGARVIATPVPSGWSGYAATAAAVSGADGTFRIAGLAPAKFQLSALAAHFASAASITATARPAKTSPMLRLELVATARVRGRVAIAGAPVAGVRLAIAQHEEAAAISQADGSFVLDHVPFGTATLVAPPYKVVAPKTLAVLASQLDNVEVELGKLGRLHGRVTRHGHCPTGVATQNRWLVRGLDPTLKAARLAN